MRVKKEFAALVFLSFLSIKKTGFWKISFFFFFTLAISVTSRLKALSSAIVKSKVGKSRVTETRTFVNCLFTFSA